MTLSLFWQDFKTIFEDYDAFVNFCETKWGDPAINEYGGEKLYSVDLYHYYPYSNDWVQELCLKANVNYQQMVKHQLEVERIWRECSYHWF